MDATLRRIAPLTGIVFVALYVIGGTLVMKDTPDFAAAPAEIQAFINGNAKGIMVGSLLLFISNPFWFIFLGCLYSAVKAKESSGGRLAAMILAAAATGTAVALVGESLMAMAAIRADGGTLDAATATVYFDAANVLGYSGSAAALSAFALALGVASLRYGAVLPKWLGVVAILLAVVFVIPPISWAAMPVGLLLVLWASFTMYRDRAGEL